MSKELSAFTGLATLLNEVSEQVEQRIDSKLKEKLDDVEKRIKDLADDKPIVYQLASGKTAKVEGLKHYQLDGLIKVVNANLPVMMVGMAGTGKTKAASQVAEALGLSFYCQSVGSQTSKSDLLGYMDANGKYVATSFRKAYEEGGVYLMDEIDAGNSNVLVVLNSALANGVCSFPDGMVARHDDFRFIATANTYGDGANREYVGRNRLDAATLDRFVVLDWLIDTKLEGALVKGLKHGEKWHRFIKALRNLLHDRGTKNTLISPRCTEKGAKLLELGAAPNEVVKAVVGPYVPTSEYNAINQLLIDCFGKSGGDGVW